MGDLYVALLHHPVYDKNGAVVTTAVTNMDVHDLSRLARAFGLRACYVATPVPTLRRLVERIMAHWDSGPGSTYNVTRKEALACVRLGNDLEGVVADVERETGVLPRVVASSARDGAGRLGFAALRTALEQDPRPVLLVLGTGWGLTREVLDRCDDILEPLRGAAADGWNHLSVRSAASIMLDRLKGAR